MSLRRNPSKPPSSQGGPPQYTPASFDPPHATFTPSLSKMTVSPSPSASLGCGGCGGKKKEDDEERAYDDDKVQVHVTKNKNGFEVVVRGKLSHDSSSDEEASTPCSRGNKHHTPCSKQETPCGGRVDTPCSRGTRSYGGRSTDSPCSKMTSPCGSGKKDSPCSLTRDPKPPNPPEATAFIVRSEEPEITTLVRATDHGMGGEKGTPSFEYHIHFTDTEMDAFQYDLCKKTVLMIEDMVAQKHRDAKSILIFGGDCVDIELRSKDGNEIKVSDVLANLLMWKDERDREKLDTVLMIGNRDGNKIRLSEHVDMIYPGQAGYDDMSVEKIASKEFVVPDDRVKRMKPWITNMFSQAASTDDTKKTNDKIMACFLRLCFIVNATMTATQNQSKAVKCEVCSGFMAYLFLKSNVRLDEKSSLYKIAIGMSGELEDMMKLEDTKFGQERQTFTQSVTGSSAGFDLSDEKVKENSQLKKMLEDAQKILSTTRKWIGEGDMRRYLQNGHVFYYHSKEEANYDVACVHAGMMAGTGEAATSVYKKVPVSYNEATKQIKWGPSDETLGKGPAEFENQIHSWYTISVENVLNGTELEEVRDLKRMLVALAGPNNEGPLYTKDEVAKPFALEEDAAKPIAWFLGHQPNAVPMFGRSDSYNKGGAVRASDKGLVVRTDTQYKRPSFCVAATFPYEHGMNIFGRLVQQAYPAEAGETNSAIEELKRIGDSTSISVTERKYWCGPRVVLQNPANGQTSRQVYRTVMWNLGFSAGVWFVADAQVEQPIKPPENDPFLTVVIGALVVKNDIFEQNMGAVLQTNQNYFFKVGETLLRGMDRTLKRPTEMANFQLGSDSDMMAIPYICTSDDTKLGRRLAINTGDGPYFKLQ